MKLVVNRKEMEFKDGTKLHEVLETLKLADKALGAVINGSIVSKCSVKGHELKDGDKIDILPALAAG